MLAIFKAVSGKATFFMVGEQMAKYPEMVEAVIIAGHEIGNHSYSHPMMTKLSAADCHEEVKRTEQLIVNMTGKLPKLFRPPYLDYNQDTQQIIKKFNYRVIGALNFDATDWEMPGVEHIVTKSYNHTSNGSILLFHDGFGNRSQTIEAVSVLVRRLVSEGYQFVTVSELLQMEK